MRPVTHRQVTGPGDDHGALHPTAVPDPVTGDPASLHVRFDEQHVPAAGSLEPVDTQGS
jgi:hypothetical protein